MDKVLAVRGLCSCFFTSHGVVRAVRDASFDLGKGEVVGLLGESGCGKSTVARSIMRLLQPPGRIVDGTVHFLGKNLLDRSDEEMRQVRGKDISMVFQDPLTYLNPVMKVGNQIGEVILQHGNRSREFAREKTLEAMKMVQIPQPAERYECYPHELSGGLKQRIIIAMAVILRPTLLIADEPTTSLDVITQAEILDLLRALCSTSGMSALLITHDLGVVAEICDRVVVMYAGEVVETSEVTTFFDKAAHPYSQDLLNSFLNLRVPEEDRLFSIPGSLPNPVEDIAGCPYYRRCRAAMRNCESLKPARVALEAGHDVACHLYDPPNGQG